MLFHWRSAGYFSVAEFILVNAAENSWQKLAAIRTEKKKPVLPTLNKTFSAKFPNSAAGKNVKSYPKRVPR